MHLLPPRPERVQPYELEDAHEVRPEPDVDWTLSADWMTELRLREVRNNQIKQQLQAGLNVCYRSSGSSLWPRVCCNDRCTYEPVRDASVQVEVGDIVFCQVQPSDRFYAHVVAKKALIPVWCPVDIRTQQHYFTITNIKGHVNGWCYAEHIYGKLIDVEH